MIREDDSVSLFEVGTDFFIGDITIYALDQVRIWAPRYGLVRSCPAFPRLANYGQAESVSLVTGECVKRSH
jgi:hypothetical protein